MNQLSPKINGLDLTMLMSAIVWVTDCPFSKAVKPDLVLAREEMDEIYERLSASWIAIRDEKGVEEARCESLLISLTSQEVSFLKLCLNAVLKECDGNPLELELRCGKTEDVQRLVSKLENP